MNNEHPPLPTSAKLLGYAGLLPQVLALALFVLADELGWIALAGGFAYAALIFSFLGGVWWGQGIALGNLNPAMLIVAVIPSLIGLALFIPWTLGWAWPEPSMLWLGLFLMLSPLVDRWLALGGADWMKLRWHLSIGLGALTLVLGSAGLAARPA
ncbi:DUF3429 family protein [Altererythrobacter luteolus]|uniref:DUF3429 family protein n=1 Tax=Pontixanthobacter luteolus TaxID=295089 RepID=A0A6I4UXY0_9SPHN|nr:DUF3429 domain-containing protein [Pontixanthobacter luteolus]MXP46799.1 DUF3429 family protein [Pontixanthobacter luteolus]